MTKTDELRAMLDERGVEYRTNDTAWAMFTEWISVYGKRVAFYENCRDKATFCMDSTGFTPEQAVNVTLGPGTCEMAYGEDDHGVDAFWCQSCGHRQAATFRHTGRGNIVMPRFCQGCGREVTG